MKQAEPPFSTVSLRSGLGGDCEISGGRRYETARLGSHAIACDVMGVRTAKVVRLRDQDRIAASGPGRASQDREDSLTLRCGFWNLP